jgi:hypothetical protein
MEKKLGRPRKTEGVISHKDFARPDRNGVGYGDHHLCFLLEEIDEASRNAEALQQRLRLATKRALTEAHFLLIVGVEFSTLELWQEPLGRNSELRSQHQTWKPDDGERERNRVNQLRI